MNNFLVGQHSMGQLTQGQQVGWFPVAIKPKPNNQHPRNICVANRNQLMWMDKNYNGKKKTTLIILMPW